MPVFVPQLERSTATDSTRAAINYLNILDMIIIEAMQDYFHLESMGTQVTFHVLNAIGYGRIVELSQQYKYPNNNKVKQHIGMKVPILLCDTIGPENVETYRRDDRIKNATKDIPHIYRHLRSWVNQYTSHRLTDQGLKKNLNLNFQKKNK